jgi:hypothetical protein
MDVILFFRHSLLLQMGPALLVAFFADRARTVSRVFWHEQSHRNEAALSDSLMK